MGIEECIPKGYIKIMEDMYRRAVTTVRMVSWAIFELPVGVGLHRRFTLRAHFGNYRFHGTRVSGNTQQSEPTPPCDLEVHSDHVFRKEKGLAFRKQTKKTGCSGTQIIRLQVT